MESAWITPGLSLALAKGWQGVGRVLTLADLCHVLLTGCSGQPPLSVTMSGSAISGSAGSHQLAMLGFLCEKEQQRSAEVC